MSSQQLRETYIYIYTKGGGGGGGGDEERKAEDRSCVKVEVAVLDSPSLSPYGFCGRRRKNRTRRNS